MDKTTKTETRVEQTQQAPKPYEAPAIVQRAPLEAVAGVCTESPGKAPLGCSVGYS